jgi:hypothetical protein
MDILWPALGISVIVGFVFYVMAGHWGRVLRQQAGTIRRLSDRVQMIEEVDNPHFRQRISESAPSPLEQVFMFSFRFSDRFWRETLQLAESDWNFVRDYGSFVGSVKLERWRSHTTATISEVLPDRKTAAWQTRTLYSYPGPGERNEQLTLWELTLARPAFGRRPPMLELALRGNSLELSGHFAGSERSDGATEAASEDEVVFFRAPLDASLLSEFRSHDPTDSANGNGGSNGHGAGSWRASYAWEDEARGIEWQLRVVDLNRKIEWERWKILESASPHVTSGS